MCEECQYTYTNHTWNWLVQVRQKVVHKRTFLFLEQEILNRRESFKIYDIDQQSDGIDFFFTEKSNCLRFVDFLHSRVPGHHTETEKLVSADVKSNTANKKHTVLFEIAALCKDDLVVIPRKMKQLVGSLQRLCIVYKINQRIHLVDPISGATGSITASQYFGCPFTSVRARMSRLRAQVITVEENGAYVQTEDDVANGDLHFCYTHMAGQLKEEQDVWVYHADLIDFADCELPNYKCGQKYIIINKAQKLDQVRVRKIRENKLTTTAVEYAQDDVEAVAEMYEGDFKPELEAEDVVVDEQGYCPM